MTAIRRLLATLSVFAFGSVVQSYVQPAEASVTKLTEIERACERALRENTIEALEDFLYRYPPEKYQNDVACYALALGAIGQFNGGNGNQPNPGNRPGDGGYSQ